MICVRGVDDRQIGDRCASCRYLQVHGATFHRSPWTCPNDFRRYERASLGRRKSVRICFGTRIPPERREMSPHRRDNSGRTPYPAAAVTCSAHAIPKLEEILAGLIPRAPRKFGRSRAIGGGPDLRSQRTDPGDPLSAKSGPASSPSNGRRGMGTARRRSPCTERGNPSGKGRVPFADLPFPPAKKSRLWVLTVRWGLIAATFFLKWLEGPASPPKFFPRRTSVRNRPPTRFPGNMPVEA